MKISIIGLGVVGKAIKKGFEKLNHECFLLDLENKNEFPNGIQGLKNCVEKAEKQGIKLGTHCLSNFITTHILIFCFKFFF